MYPTCSQVEGTWSNFTYRRDFLGEHDLEERQQRRSPELRDIKNATADDLEMERASPMCVSSSGLRWHMARAAVYVADCVLEEHIAIGSFLLKVHVNYIFRTS